MKKLLQIITLFFLLISIPAICQNKEVFRLQPIVKKQIDGFETEGCRFTQSKTSKDRILLISFNGYVAVQINNKILISDYSYNQTTDKTTFVGNEISGYIKLTELGAKDKYSSLQKGLLTIIYKGNRREIPIYGSCDEY